MMSRGFWSPSFNLCSQMLCVWTPQLVIGAFAGYYSVGYAYDKGVMAVIDRVAIRILKPKVGYVGLGVVMPTVQWYAAWGVRVSAAAIAVGICSGAIKTGKLVWACFGRSDPKSEQFSTTEGEEERERIK